VVSVCFFKIIISGFPQWRGNYFWTGRGARPRATKSRTQNRCLRWNWRVFLSGNKRSPKKKVFAGFEAFIWPENIHSPKKRSLPDFGAFFIPKHGSRHRSQRGGAKVAQGGQNISRGALPSCPLLSAPMDFQKITIRGYWIAYGAKL